MFFQCCLSTFLTTCEYLREICVSQQPSKICRLRVSIYFYSAVTNDVGWKCRNLFSNWWHLSLHFKCTPSFVPLTIIYLLECHCQSPDLDYYQVMWHHSSLLLHLHFHSASWWMLWSGKKKSLQRFRLVLILINCHSVCHGIHRTMLYYFLSIINQNWTLLASSGPELHRCDIIIMQYYLQLTSD